MFWLLKPLHLIEITLKVIVIGPHKTIQSVTSPPTSQIVPAFLAILLIAYDSVQTQNHNQFVLARDAC